MRRSFTPWFIAVRQMGWDFVGRLRNKNLVLMDGAQSWQLSSLFFEQATGKPTHLGHVLLTEKEKVPVHLVLYKTHSGIAEYFVIVQNNPSYFNEAIRAKSNRPKIAF